LDIKTCASDFHAVTGASLAFRCDEIVLGKPHLTYREAFLMVLKNAINDQYDYI
jgi:hypothetical protein